MQVRLEPCPHIDNKGFNKRIESSSTSLTSPESHIFDYVMSPSLREYKGDSIFHFEATSLGDDEFEVFKKLTEHGIPSIICVNGALGSGKTSTVQYLLKKMEGTIKCQACAVNSTCRRKVTTYLRFDFSNLNSSRKDEIKLIAAFYEYTHKRLSAYASKYLANDDVMQRVEDFVLYNSESSDPEHADIVLAELNRIRKLITSPKWKKLSAGDKLSAILDIFDLNNDTATRIERIFDLFRILSLMYPVNIGCNLIIVDNIDAFSPDVQRDIANSFGWWARSIKTRIVICLRPSSKGNITTMEDKGTFIIESHHHAPPDIVDILNSRLHSLLSGRVDDMCFSNTDQSDRTLFKARAEHITHLLQYPTSKKFQSFFSALTGSSIRRGLLLSQRLFLNNMVKYDKNSDHDYNFKRALLIPLKAEHQIIEQNDQFVINLYLDITSQTYTFLNIRILALINTLVNREGSPHCSLKELFDCIKIFHPYTDQQILKQLEYLSSLYKRTIFLSSIVENIKNIKKTDWGNYLVELTNSGRSYLREMTSDFDYFEIATNSFEIKINEFNTSVKVVGAIAKNELCTNKYTKSFMTQYFENGIEMVRSIEAPSNEFSLVERSYFVRKHLEVVFFTEIFQIAKYKYNNNADQIHNTHIYTLPTVVAVGDAIFSILKKMAQSGVVRAVTECKDWLNFITNCFNTNLALFEKRDEKLQTLIEHFEQLMIRSTPYSPTSHKKTDEKN